MQELVGEAEGHQRRAGEDKRSEQGAEVSYSKIALNFSEPFFAYFFEIRINRLFIQEFNRRPRKRPAGPRYWQRHQQIKYADRLGHAISPRPQNLRCIQRRKQ